MFQTIPPKIAFVDAEVHMTWNPGMERHDLHFKVSPVCLFFSEKKPGLLDRSHGDMWWYHGDIPSGNLT